MGNAEHDYLAISEQLKNEINEGFFTEEDRFPTEFELTKRFESEISTIRKAIQVLLDEKIIIEKHGVGLFLNPKPLFIAGIEELASVTTMIQQAGMEAGTIFIDFSEGEVDKEQAEMFNCPDSAALMTIKRVRTANNQPVVYCIDQVLKKDLTIGTEELLATSIFDAIEQSGEIYIEHAVAKIEPVAYDSEASSILRCGVDVPLLALEQKHYSSKGEMVLYSKNFFRADKFSFHVNRKRI